MKRLASRKRLGVMETNVSGSLSKLQNIVKLSVREIQGRKVFYPQAGGKYWLPLGFAGTIRH